MTPSSPHRREQVLDRALETFARHGYRKTSMDQVASQADVSRPGLYFMFDSKEHLFRAALERMITKDLQAIEATLADVGQPLRQRLISAFDTWAGEYVGQRGRDIQALIQHDPSLTGPHVESAPARFAELVLQAVARELSYAKDITETLMSASIGIKHQVDDRGEYRERVTRVIDLLLRGQ